MATPSDNGPLLDPAFLRRLEALRLLLRRGGGGAPAGGRATRRKGGVAEFESHRDYAPGDDPRSVDWFAYARTGRLVVKEYARDEVVQLRVVLDRSASMGAEGPAKWERALEVSAALAALALFARATVEVFAAGERRLERVGGAEAENGLQPLLRALQRVSPGGVGAPVLALAEARRGPWATAFVSDLLDGADPRPALATPPNAGFGETIVVHLLAAAEARPAVAGALALQDSETGAGLDCVADEALRARYVQALADHRARWQRAVALGGGRFVHASGDEPVEAIVTRIVNPIRVRGGTA